LHAKASEHGSHSSRVDKKNHRQMSVAVGRSSFDDILENILEYARCYAYILDSL
jgi:hypothetical protein